MITLFTSCLAVVCILVGLCAIAYYVLAALFIALYVLLTRPGLLLTLLLLVGVAWWLGAI